MWEKERAVAKAVALCYMWEQVWALLQQSSSSVLHVWARGSCYCISSATLHLRARRSSCYKGSSIVCVIGRGSCCNNNSFRDVWEQERAVATAEAPSYVWEHEGAVVTTVAPCYMWEQEGAVAMTVAPGYMHMKARGSCCNNSNFILRAELLLQR